MNYSKEGKIIGTFIFAFLFLGIFSGIYGIKKIENYYNPYMFFIIISLLGITLGHFASSFIKPYMKLNIKQLNDFYKTKIWVICGIIGILVALGSKANSELSKVDFIEISTVVQKERIPYRYGRPSSNYLFVNINRKIEKLRSNYNYWERIRVGDKINIQKYKSKLGFDYIVLTDE
jgi:hypothetical protein